MKRSTVVALRLGLFGSAAAAACVCAPIALADDGTQQANLGGAVDVGGGQSWTVAELEPSSDAIPYRPTGTLWEAEATAQAAQGGIPVIPGFSARAGDVSYPVLWPVPTAEGVNPSALPPGGTTAEGKLYFVVTGPAPTSVAYSSGGHDTAVWVQPPPVAEASGGGVYVPSRTGPLASVGAPAAIIPAPSAPVPAAVPVAPVPAGSAGTPTPAAAPAPTSAGTPLSAGSTPTPAATSAGTPLATNSSGTPAPNAATPAPTAAGTPAVSGTPGGSSAGTPAAVTPQPAGQPTPTATTAPSPAPR